MSSWPRLWRNLRTKWASVRRNLFGSGEQLTEQGAEYLALERLARLLALGGEAIQSYHLPDRNGVGRGSDSIRSCLSCSVLPPRQTVRVGVGARCLSLDVENEL